MLKLARRAVVVLLSAGLLVPGLSATGLPATSALAARAAGARPGTSRPVAARPGTARAAAARPDTARARAAPAAVAPAGRPGRIRARGGELANAVTGQRLWRRTMNRQRPMGSITKVMTALVVIRAGHLNRRVTITGAIPAYIRRHPDASSAGLRAGDVLTVRQLLDAMLLPSGCDAALALAKAYGPGRQAFVADMNATARQLGMLRTHFSNFDGMPLPTEQSTYSTPGDLITLGEAAMRLAPFRRIVRQRSHSLAATAAHHAYSWRSTNLLLGAYPGAVGIKTGSTKAAGYCLLFEATRRGVTLIGVVLHSGGAHPMARFTAATRLLNWGFSTSVAPPRRPAGPIRD